MLAIIEQIFMILLSKEIVHLQYEYISIKYATFKFSGKEEKFCGLNILIKVLFPLIYILLLSGFFYSIHKEQYIKNIYMITIIYYLIRWIYIIFILNRKELHDWKSEIITSIFGIILNIFIYNIFITKTNQIFISINELRDGIWIGIITFLFVLIRNYIYEYARIDSEKSRQRKENYILTKYSYYKTKYDYLINEDNKELESIVYGIMIYENYNRPFFFRLLEYIKCTIKGEATLGIMQVKSKVWISNETSIKKGYKILKDAYIKEQNNNETDYEKLNNIIKNYNLGKNYTEEVLYIIELIKEI